MPRWVFSFADGDGLHPPLVQPPGQVLRPGSEVEITEPDGEVLPYRVMTYPVGKSARALPEQRVQS